jgi:hypothetical protein
VALSDEPPARLPPLVIKLQQAAVPVRVKLRRYTPPQKEFLRVFVSELERNGLVNRNPAASWFAAPVLVPKDGPAKFRFTVDLRPVSKQTVPAAWPMPHLESDLEAVSGSRFFATSDLSHGYCQLQLDEASQECQSFITPDGICSPTRALHGTRNAVSHMQSSLQEILEPLRAQVLAWLDDILLHAATEASLLTYLRVPFQLCRDACYAGTRVSDCTPASANCSPEKFGGVAD